MPGKGIYHRHRMARGINIGAALLCLICVIALCIAPSVDIPDTTLKSFQIIFLMMLTFIGGVLLLSGIVHLALLSHRFSVGQQAALIRSMLLPIQTNCVQQC
jgi:hypothetical protein